jgi:hypothetical protein
MATGVHAIPPADAGRNESRHGNFLAFVLTALASQPRAAPGRSARAKPGLAVEQFSGDVQVTGMSRGLLDHV